MFSLNGDQWQVCKVGVHDEKKAFKIGDIRKKNSLCRPVVLLPIEWGPLAIPFSILPFDIIIIIS